MPYQEGDRFTVDSSNWTDFVAPSGGCDYANFINEGAGDVEFRQDSARSETGQVIAVGSQKAIGVGRENILTRGLRDPRFAAGTVLGSFRAVSGTASIFPTVS